MKAIFYTNKSDSKNVDKILEYLLESDIILKNASNLMTPIIDLQLKFEDSYFNEGIVDSNNDDIVDESGNDLSININVKITDINYCYIPSLSRYYYVTNIILVTSELFRLELQEDILMSFKSQFRELEAFVTRNQFTYNALVKDDLASFYYDKFIVYYDMNEGGDTRINTNSNYKSNNISLCVINNQRSVVSSTNRPTAPSSDLASPYFWNGGIIAYNNVYCADVEDINGLSKWLVKDSTLASFVLKLTVFPFELKGYSGITHLYLGDTELEADDGLPDIYVNELVNPQGDFYTICDKVFEPENSNSFLGREPYAKYELYVPYLSYIPIDADKIIGKRIKITYALDYKSGNAQVYVIADNKTIFTSNCQLGIDIPVNSTNALQVQNNKISNAMSLSLGLLGGAVGMFSGNPVGAVGGVISASKSVASFIHNANTNYNTASGTYSNTNGGLFGKSTPHIRITRYKPHIYNNDYFKLYGRPLNEVVRLSNMRGYTVIGDIHLDNINATEDEKNRLYALLKDGIIL